MKIILISGVSGSGKSVALNVLEDHQFYCVDNLPIPLVDNLLETALLQKVEEIAIAIDVRNSAALEVLPPLIVRLKAQGHDVRCLFLNADNRTLITRYSESRRKHPLSHVAYSDGEHFTSALIEAIDREREILSPIADLAHVIDTSQLPSRVLRQWVLDFVEHDAGPQMLLTFTSFGFKHGLPKDADFVFDARQLPNPYYDEALRPLTGLDQPVQDYLLGKQACCEYLDDICRFLERWLPSFQADQRSYVTVAIGCTGGQHRSVYLVERLKLYFSSQYNVLSRHRHIHALGGH